jgi:type II secretory pathway pseudopilin PulG
LQARVLSRPVNLGKEHYRLRNSAFTLLDLLTALGLFAVLAAIAIPNWTNQLPAYRLNTAARQVQSELHRIKSQAVAGNIDFRVVFMAPSFYRIERKTDTQDYEPTGENKVLPEGIIYGNGSAANISFTPRGTANSDTITLCNSRKEGKNVIVFGGTGRVRVVSGPC